MNHTARGQGLTLPSAHPERAHVSRVGSDAARRPYAAPRLVEIVTAPALLEVLGPAQANYGAP